MKSRITRCLLLISLIPLIFGAEYPNAWTDFEECGLEQPGYVCDPDNLMDPIDLIDLNNYIHTYFQGTGLETGTFCLNEEDGAIASVAIVYDVRDALGSEADGLTNEETYEKFAEHLRQDLQPYGRCRNNVYVIFGRNPGYRTCDDEMCTNSYFYFSSSLTADGLSTESIFSTLQFSQWAAFDMNTNFVSNLTQEEIRELRKFRRKVSRALAKAVKKTLQVIQLDLVEMFMDTMRDAIDSETTGDVKVDFSWSFGFSQSLQPWFSPYVIHLLLSFEYLFRATTLVELK